MNFSFCPYQYLATMKSRRHEDTLPIHKVVSIGINNCIVMESRPEVDIVVRGHVDARDIDMGVELQLIENCRDRNWCRLSLDDIERFSHHSFRLKLGEEEGHDLWGLHLVIVAHSDVIFEHF